MKNSYLVSAFGSYLLFRRLLVFPLVLLTMLVQARVNFADTYTQNFNTLAATGASNTWMNDVTIFSCDMDATGRGLRGGGSDGTYFSPAGAAVAGWISEAFTNASTTSITSSQNPSFPKIRPTSILVGRVFQELPLQAQGDWQAWGSGFKLYVFESRWVSETGSDPSPFSADSR